MKKLLTVIIALTVIAVLIVANLVKEKAPISSHSITLNGVTITPLEILEDSRCPEDVQCVWAGTVKLLTKLEKLSGNFEQVLELGKSVSTGDEQITLIEVSPNPKEGESIPFESYRFEFEVKDETQIPNPNTGTCHVTGCSAQLCTEEPDVVSTCEWNEAYACYQTARCERQSNGQCGWTYTPELNQCLQNAR